MNQLPTELLPDIVLHMDIRSYLKFRSASKRLWMLLDKIPTLSFKAYRDSTIIFGEMVVSHAEDGSVKYVECKPKYGLYLREQCRFKMDLSDLNSQSALYLSLNGHLHEFTRAIQSVKSAFLPPASKYQMLAEVIRKGSLMSHKAALILLKRFHVFYSLDALSACLIFEYGQVALVSHLLSTHSLNLGVVPSIGLHLHQYAYKCGHVEILLLILRDVRIDATVVDENGRTAVHYVCEFNAPDILYSFLLDVSVSVNGVDCNGWYPMHHAAYNGSHACLQMLLSHPEVNPCCTTGDGCHPLHFACREGATECVRLLLGDARVDWDAVNVYGQTAVDYIRKTKRSEIVPLFGIGMKIGKMMDGMDISGTDVAMDISGTDNVVMDISGMDISMDI